MKAIRWFTTASCLALLILIAINAVYQAKPFYDDYPYAASTASNGIFTNIYDLLTSYKVRYTHIAFWMSFLGLVDILEYYYLGTFFCLSLLLIASLYFFCALRSYLSWGECIFLAVTLLLLHLCLFSVNLRDALYWMAAALSYQIGVVFLLFSLGTLIHLYIKPRPWPLTIFLFLSLAISIFLATGANEAFLALQPVLYAMLIIFQFTASNTEHTPANKKLRRHRKQVLAYAFIIALLSLAFYFTLPGFYARHSSYGAIGRRSLVQAIGWSLIYGEKYWYKGFVTMVLLSSTVFLKPTLLRFASGLSSSLKNIQSWRLAILVLLYISGPVFLYLPVSYAFQIKNPNPTLEARVTVPLSGFFVFGWPFFTAVIYSLFVRLEDSSKVMILRYAKLSLVVIFSCIIAAFALGYRDDFIRNHTFFNRHTIKHTIADLKSGRSQDFDDKITRVYKALQAAQKKGIKDIIIYDPYPIPLSSFSTANNEAVIATDDPSDWRNNWTCSFFGCKSIRTTKNPAEVNVHY